MANIAFGGGSGGDDTTDETGSQTDRRRREPEDSIRELDSTSESDPMTDLGDTTSVDRTRGGRELRAPGVDDTETDTGSESDGGQGSTPVRSEPPQAGDFDGVDDGGTQTGSPPTAGGTEQIPDDGGTPTGGPPTFPDGPIPGDGGVDESGDGVPGDGTEEGTTPVGGPPTFEDGPQTGPQGTPPVAGDGPGGVEQVPGSPQPSDFDTYPDYLRASVADQYEGVDEGDVRVIQTGFGQYEVQFSEAGAAGLIGSWLGVPEDEVDIDRGDGPGVSIADINREIGAQQDALREYEAERRSTLELGLRSDLVEAGEEARARARRRRAGPGGLDPAMTREQRAAAQVSEELGFEVTDEDLSLQETDDGDLSVELSDQAQRASALSSSAEFLRRDAEIERTEAGEFRVELPGDTDAIEEALTRRIQTGEAFGPQQTTPLDYATEVFAGGVRDVAGDVVNLADQADIFSGPGSGDGAAEAGEDLVLQSIEWGAAGAGEVPASLLEVHEATEDPLAYEVGAEAGRIGARRLDDINFESTQAAGEGTIETGERLHGVAEDNPEVAADVAAALLGGALLTAGSYAAAPAALSRLGSVSRTGARVAEFALDPVRVTARAGLRGASRVRRAAGDADLNPRNITSDVEVVRDPDAPTFDIDPEYIPGASQSARATDIESSAADTATNVARRVQEGVDRVPDDVGEAGRRTGEVLGDAADTGRFRFEMESQRLERALNRAGRRYGETVGEAGGTAGDVARFRLAMERGRVSQGLLGQQFGERIQSGVSSFRDAGESAGLRLGEIGGAGRFRYELGTQRVERGLNELGESFGETFRDAPEYGERVGRRIGELGDAGRFRLEVERRRFERALNRGGRVTGEGIARLSQTDGPESTRARAVGEGIADLTRLDIEGRRGADFGERLGFGVARAESRLPEVSRVVDEPERIGRFIGDRAERLGDAGERLGREAASLRDLTIRVGDPEPSGDVPNDVLERARGLEWNTDAFDDATPGDLGDGTTSEFTRATSDAEVDDGGVDSAIGVGQTGVGLERPGVTARGQDAGPNAEFRTGSEFETDLGDSLMDTEFSTVTLEEGMSRGFEGLDDRTGVGVADRAMSGVDGDVRGLAAGTGMEATMRGTGELNATVTGTSVGVGTESAQEVGVTLDEALTGTEATTTATAASGRGRSGVLDPDSLRSDSDLAELPGFIEERQQFEEELVDPLLGVDRESASDDDGGLFFGESESESDGFEPWL